MQKNEDKVSLKPVPGYYTPLGFMLTEMADPTPWLIEGVAVEGEMLMAHGPSHAGKTYVVLDMGMHLAFGRSHWHGYEVTGMRPVVYVPTEGRRGIARRTGSWLKVNEADMMPPIAEALPSLEELFAVKVRTYETAEEREERRAIEAAELAEVTIQTPFIRYDDPELSLSDDASVQRLAALVDAVARGYEVPPVVIFDVVGDLTGGIDENSVDFKHALRKLHPDVLLADFEGNAIGCTTLLVHHEGHTSSGRPRGHSGVIGLVDNLMGMDSKGNGEPATLTQIRVRNHKQRNEDKFMPFILNLEKPISGLVNPVITGRPDPTLEAITLKGWDSKRAPTNESTEVTFEVDEDGVHVRPMFGDVDPSILNYVRRVRDLTERSGGHASVPDLKRALGHNGKAMPSATESNHRDKAKKLGLVTETTLTGRTKGVKLTPDGAALAGQEG